MGYTVTYEADAGYIAIRLEGRLDRRTLRTLVRDVLRAAREHECRRILNDARDATVGVSTLDIVDLPGHVAASASNAGVSVYELRRAIVVSADIDDFAFFETVSRNRHQNVRMFRDIDAARAWLLDG